MAGKRQFKSFLLFFPLRRNFNMLENSVKLQCVIREYIRGFAGRPSQGAVLGTTAVEESRQT